MNFIYYKLVRRQTGEPLMANIGWATSFEEIKELNETKNVKCMEISREEHRELVRQGY